MLEIIAKSKDYVICIKPVGVSSEHDMVKLLSEQLDGEIYCVHRLDNAVGGIMVYARNKKAASLLSQQIAEHQFKKVYLAVIEGTPENEEGTYTDLLFKDSSKNKTYVVSRMRKGVKEASLNYKVIAVKGNLTLVKVSLIKGRTHQIRVQFASRKMPLVGDSRYGSKIKSDIIGLRSYSISFTDPETNDGVSFTASDEPLFPFNIFE